VRCPRNFRLIHYPAFGLEMQDLSNSEFVHSSTFEISPSRRDDASSMLSPFTGGESDPDATSRLSSDIR
jgi:hypothetical protein